jgi:heme/copper-type cytochrome/quinol oxidase subunit 1
MSHAIAMGAIAFAVVAANILFTKLIFGRHYNDAPKREKMMMDVLSFGVMVALFLIYIVLISNL